MPRAAARQIPALVSFAVVDAFRERCGARSWAALAHLVDGLPDHEGGSVLFCLLEFGANEVAAGDILHGGAFTKARDKQN